jgi:branched-chain amino acid transport system substrate-binding protein
VQNGKREIIWPDDVRSAAPKIPVPAWDAR